MGARQRGKESMKMIGNVRQLQQIVIKDHDTRHQTRKQTKLRWASERGPGSCRLKGVFIDHLEGAELVNSDLLRCHAAKISHKLLKDLDKEFWCWLLTENFFGKYFRIKLDIGLGRRLLTLEETGEKVLSLNPWCCLLCMATF